MLPLKHGDTSLETRATLSCTPPMCALNVSLEAQEHLATLSCTPDVRSTSFTGSTGAPGDAYYTPPMCVLHASLEAREHLATLSCTPVWALYMLSTGAPGDV